MEPYCGRLETFEIYGVEMLRRPGAKAHDWFAGVRLGSGSVKFFLLPMHTDTFRRSLSAIKLAYPSARWIPHGT